MGCKPVVRELVYDGAIKEANIAEGKSNEKTYKIFFMLNIVLF